MKRETRWQASTAASLTSPWAARSSARPPTLPTTPSWVRATSRANTGWWCVRRTAPAAIPCDLSVAYTEAYSDTETAALDYGPVPDTDNMIIIDRSGSMAGTKIDAAQEAGRLYVDSYSTGDRVGVLSFNDTPDL